MVIINNKSLEAQISFKSIIIEKLRYNHIPEILEIWKANCESTSKIVEAAPELWLKDTSYFEGFITDHIERNRGIAALIEERVVGYWVYDNFQFHG